jgi:RNA polymerase-binding transcription factor DksA
MAISLGLLPRSKRTRPLAPRQKQKSNQPFPEWRSRQYGLSFAREAKAIHQTEVFMGRRVKQEEQRCTLCGQPISEARLEALPGVTTCIECARKQPLRVDPRKFELSEASPINRNGFAPTD